MFPGRMALTLPSYYLAENNLLISPLFQCTICLIVSNQHRRKKTLISAVPLICTIRSRQYSLHYLLVIKSYYKIQKIFFGIPLVWLILFDRIISLITLRTTVIVPLFVEGICYGSARIRHVQNKSDQA